MLALNILHCFTFVLVLVGESLIAPESFNLLEKCLQKITHPVLLIWGKEDNV